MKQSPLPAYFPYGYAVSDEAWDRFAFAELPGALLGAGKSEAVRAAQLLAQRLAPAMPETHPPKAGELLAMGIILEALRTIAFHYASAVRQRALDDALAFADGRRVPLSVLNDFVKLFPPYVVHSGRVDAEGYLAEAGSAMTGMLRATLETVLLSLVNENPAMQPYAALHDDAALRARGSYLPFVEALDAFFAAEALHPQSKLTLLAMLRAPMRAAPESLDGQLDFIRAHWAAILPEDLLERLVLARGVLKEEFQFRGHGPGLPQPLQFFRSGSEYVEYEAFTIDKDWMPNVVLIAKQTYVWLDQLSKKYKCDVFRLDQVPDEELDQLARWGINGLWLIGLWERSVASRDIKRRMGNPEAEASAYSLHDYTIAHDLGGEHAYRDLAARAWRRGIRLASDMVPNHVGIYSRWVLEHPDWFIQSHEPPFPSYTFDGPDLSYDSSVGLYIEDGYWTHRDAAVVFKRVDRRNGQVRYLYHGNDGTSMPWNDTAQLDFLNPEVREAVIRTVIHVARMFPIIRFDAAMTLAKKHYQRLWFPKPGDEGAIPSRAAHGMSRDEFDQRIPHEFWREVVDRVAAEAPDTLLLAEAFWLMEGYFVRTLGMHRVYNSAFMNMLKMEKNAEYRLTIKNVLEFSPEVLQRFVNFMNNPDEDTAEAQFGRGDKYFGVAVLMATMPGLPMFGHGQVEGFTEKYGMEYRRAYRDEQPDTYLLWRHEREIFPLLHRRRMFSGSRHFALFDFYAPEGHVDENVFAYTNRDGESRALVVFNNAYNATRGTVRVSSAINEGSVDAPQLRQWSIGEALGLQATDTGYYILRDHISGLEYLHHSRDLCLQGLFLELGSYQSRVFLEWREVHDLDLSWAALHGLLKGHGVPSMADAYKEMHLKDVLEPFDAMMRPEVLRGLLLGEDATEEERARWAEAAAAYRKAARKRIGLAGTYKPEEDSPEASKALTPAEKVQRDAALSEDEPCHFAFLLADNIRVLDDAWAGAGAVRATAVARDWMLPRHTLNAMKAYGLSERDAADCAALNLLLVEGPAQLAALEEEVWGPVLHTLLDSEEARAFLRVHPHGGKRWMNKEQLERLGRCILLAVQSRDKKSLASAREEWQVILDAAADCSYDFDATLAVMK